MDLCLGSLMVGMGRSVEDVSVLWEGLAGACSACSRTT